MRVTTRDAPALQGSPWAIKALCAPLLCLLLLRSALLCALLCVSAGQRSRPRRSLLFASRCASTQAGKQAGGVGVPCEDAKSEAGKP